jgi:hypothetical protein
VESFAKIDRPWGMCCVVPINHRQMPVFGDVRTSLEVPDG